MLEEMKITTSTSSTITTTANTEDAPPSSPTLLTKKNQNLKLTLDLVYMDRF